MSDIDTSDVRASWVHGEATAPFYSDEHARQAEKARAEFDAWLAEHDRHVKAGGHREGYQTARDDMLSGAFIGGPTYETLRDSFTGRRVQAKALRKAAPLMMCQADQEHLEARAAWIEADHA